MTEHDGVVDAGDVELGRSVSRGFRILKSVLKFVKIRFQIAYITSHISLTSCNCMLKQIVNSASLIILKLINSY